MKRYRIYRWGNVYYCYDITKRSKSIYHADIQQQVTIIIVGAFIDELNSLGINQ